MPIIFQKPKGILDLIKNDVYVDTYINQSGCDDSTFNSLKPIYSDYDVRLRTHFNLDSEEILRTITRQKRYHDSYRINLGQRNNIPVIKNHLDLFVRRRSRRNTRPSSDVDLEELGTILKYSAGVSFYQDHYFRNLPSGGQRYPLEIYIFLYDKKNKRKKTDSVGRFYHYDPLDHCLNLASQKIDTNSIKSIFPSDQTFILNASAVVMVTAVSDRVAVKYRRSANKLIHTELGHLGQNMWLISELLKVNFFPVSAIWEKYFYQVIKINPLKEKFLSAFVISKVRE